MVCKNNKVLENREIKKKIPANGKWFMLNVLTTYDKTLL
jgi:hypothetical protein